MYTGFGVEIRSTWKTMQRQEDYIKLDLQEMGWNVMDWINLALNRYKWWEVTNISFL